MQTFAQQLTLPNIENGFMLLGACLIAVLLIMFFWHLTAYVFFKGDDAHRIHAKMGILNTTISLVFLLIAWWIFERIAGFFG